MSGEAKVRQAEVAISIVLRFGVLISIALVLAGLGLTFARHPSYGSLTGTQSYHSLTYFGTRFPHTLPQLFHSLVVGDGQGLIGLGIVVLILTPVMRVVVAVVSFTYEADRKMTIITLFVLFVLVGSFFVGGG